MRTHQLRPFQHLAVENGGGLMQNGSAQGYFHY